MQYFRSGVIALRGLALLGLVMAGSSGCGWIADTDRIVIAKIGDKNITRGTLSALIYDMPDDKRPIIRTLQDYLRVLNQYIDKEIKIPLGQELAAKGEIKIDRDAVREEFFKSAGDKEETYRHMWTIPVPKPGEESQLMQIYNLSAQEIQSVKDIIEQETDVMLEKIQGDQAVTYLAQKAFLAKELVLDENDLRAEYEVNKENFKSFESLTILGLQFPTAQPGASAEASKVRERLNAGEAFDDILNEFLAKDIRYGIESVIENNPALERFKGFWQEASGAQVGDVLGPTYMPDYNRVKSDANGQPVQETVPECWIVFKVLEAKPAEILPFEQARPYVSGPVAFAAMMEKLRDEKGVEIYEDKIPEPRGGNKDIFAN
jgi:hypothetical protein